MANARAIKPGAAADGGVLNLQNDGTPLAGGPFSTVDGIGGGFANLGSGVASYTPPSSGVGPGTVNTVALFTGVHAVGDSTIKQVAVPGTPGSLRALATKQFGIGDDPQTVGFFQKVVATIVNDGYFETASAFAKGWQCSITQDGSLDAGGVTWSGSYTAENVFTNADYTNVRGFLHADFLTPGAKGTMHVQNYIGFDAPLTWDNNVSIDVVVGFQCVPSQGSTPATVAYGFFSDLSGLTPGNVWGFYTPSDPCFFGGGTVNGGPTTLQSSLSVPTAAHSGSYTLPDGDITNVVDASAGPVVVSLPAASTMAGRWVNIKRVDGVLANAVTVTPNGSDLIDGAASLAITSQYQSYNLQSDGVSNWWVL